MERLARRGERVVVIDDFNDYYSPRLKRANAKLAAAAGDVAFVEGDIRDVGLLRKVFEESSISRVVHLAGRAGVRPSVASPALYVDVNVNGTLNLLDLARDHKVKGFTFASSSMVYGASLDVPFCEDAPADRPASPYGATKRAAELLVYNYHHLYGLRATCLRFFSVYGPRQRPDMALHKFTKAIVAGKPFPFFGDGSAARDCTYIDDIVDGVEAATYADCAFEVINLGDSKPVTLAEMVETISRAVGKKAILDRQPDQPGDVPITFADITKAGKLLGFRPKVSFEEGINRFAAWYMKAKADGLVD